ncbi:MAG: DNA polymerase III subunit alpha, partial [Betaproteobacteria bacterium]|nr:DNA polymerase III subunit alpha [Betaproteobacteria bacterium]
MSAMSQPSFVHLRLHSEYSVTDGIVRLDDAVEAAVADGMPALALTDLANVFGLVKFYQAARGKGLKPVIGCDVWIENESERDKPQRLLLLCQSRAGYRNLCELLTRAYRSNQYRGRAELKRGWFAAPASDGLIALSGAHSGDVGLALLAGNDKHALELARAWAALFPQRYYIELQRLQHNAASPLENCVQQSLQLASTLRLPVVATHPVKFLKPDDFRAHEARVCIAEGYMLADQRRPRRYSPDQYFKTQAEMAQLYADIPQALANSAEIAKRCNFTIELGKSRLPLFPTPQGESLDDYLHDRAFAGLEARLAQLYPDAAQRAAKAPEYRARLDFEIKTVLQMGFAGYFLIVADFINWAKTNGVPVGPGRGSGAGSLVAYSLGITDLDPLRYNLLFERFLNPERVSMPDFDIDFCQDGRDRVIEYVRSKYGADSVSQIVTFGTMAARAVVRDVGRVLDLGYNFCDQLAKLIPFQPGKYITLHRRTNPQDDQTIYAREVEPLINQREQQEEEVRELLELAERLEGLTRNVGMHAGGVLIAPGKLTDFCPLYAAEGSASVVSQFDMKDVEAAGLVKFDFLGLTTLTILDWTLRYIKRLDPSSTLTLDALPLDDADAYRLFASAKTTAIFQFESRGMRDLLKQARPDCFEDIIALVALYRPGPMELIPDFIARKHGKPFDYPDPRVKSVLSETYGIMVYQEQVMQMAQIIGGYSLGAADLLRRAMGKKLPEEMAQHRGIFRDGAGRNGLKQAKADELFDLMEKFAGYGFNKCIVGSTQVQDARTGTRWTVQELFKRWKSLDLVVHSLGDDWRLRARAVRDVVWNGRRPTFELRTALGRCIVATGNHPLRTLDGWIPLSDLAPGDRIATPRRLDLASTARWPEHELIVLGGLLSEGNTCHPTCLYYYNNDAELIADFTRAASGFPNTVARVARRADDRLEVCVSTGRDARFRKGQRPWNATEGNAALARDDLPARSGVFLWAQQLGLLNRRADQKRVPGAVFTLADENIALVLGRMWSGDGFFIGPSNTVPYYATSSEGLARDVQDLLLRLGVVARIQAKRFKYRGGLRPGYAVYLLGEDSVRRFVECLVPHCVGRDVQIRGLKARLALLAGGASSKDTVPGTVRRRVDAARIGAGLTWRELEVQSAVSMREFYGRGSVGKRGFRRATVGRLAAYFNDDGLRALATSDVYWDTDLEVEGDHNFVADGLIVHNSHAAAYALVAYQTAYFKAHHPAAFMAANMSAAMDDTDKTRQFHEDALAIGLKVLRPDINGGEYRFVPLDAKTLSYGLGSIKGTGESAITAIVAARQKNGPFKDLFDFCERIDKRIVNRRVIEALIRAGAFDALDDHRARLLASVGIALGAAEQLERNAQQVSLFGGTDAAEHSRPALVQAARWDQHVFLREEKAALGFYLSGHPFTAFREEIGQFVRTTLDRLTPSGGDYGAGTQTVLIAGVVESMRFQKTQNSRMLIISLGDGTATQEVTVYSEIFDQCREIVVEDAVLVIEAKVRNVRRGGGEEAEAVFLRVNAEKIYDLSAARNRFARGVRLT